MRRVSVAVIALLLTACPAPRRVSGVVFAGGATTVTGSRALSKPVQGASVTWSCPPGTGPAPQTLTTDWGGTFKSKDFYTDMPNECELVISKPGHLEFRERASSLCAEPHSWGCSNLHVAVELRPIEAVAAAPLDAPKTGDIQTVLEVIVAADGTTKVDGKLLTSDEGILHLAKAAREKNPELRAVIKADASVPHGRVIHVLDLLKQAQVTKIAFGVTPL